VDQHRSTGDFVLGTRDVPALVAHRASKGKGPVTIPVSIRLGSYYILVCADDPDKVPESSEANNCQATGNCLKVTLP
jgi:hypothetical protein